MGTSTILSGIHLGSERVSVSAAGALEDDIDYYPFGATLSYSSTGSGNLYTFTGDESDTESSTLHTAFRQHSPSLGRWLRPDPYNGSYNLANPQSLNRYSYVLNMPMQRFDPLGLEDCDTFDADGNCVVNSGPPDSGGGGGGGGGGGSGGGGGGTCPAGQVCTTVTVTAEPDPLPPLEMSPPLYYALQSNGNIFSCASQFGNKYSMAGGLHALGVGNNGGAGGFLTNALGGNAFSGFTDAVSSGMSLADLAFSGTNLGFGGSTAMQKGISGVVTDGAFGGAWSSVTGAGQTIQTLNGASSLASTGIDATEFASGVGLVKLGYDGLSYLVGLAHCAN